MLNLALVSASATIHAVRVCIVGSPVNTRDRPCKPQRSLHLDSVARPSHHDAMQL